jgi:glycosyl transferase, family 25
MNSLPPFWVLSLERARERREFVKRGFVDLGVAFELIDAVDGSRLTDDQRRRYSHVRSLIEVGRGLTAGDLGCSLSHLAVYQRMVDEQVPEVVVLEDDAQPTTDLLALLEAESSFPPDWDVVSFRPLFRRGSIPVGAPLLDGKYRICSYRRNPYGTSCYLLRLSAAARLLRVGYPVRMPPDDLIFRRRPAGLRMYGIQPGATVLGEFRSELGARSEAVARGKRSTSLWEAPVVAAGKAMHKARAMWDRSVQ